MIVLDTNVVSEAMRPAPAERVLSWLARQPSSGLFTTTITQAEILYGLELMPRGKRRLALGAAVDAMFAEDFAGRILAFDGDARRARSHTSRPRAGLVGGLSRNGMRRSRQSRNRGALRWRLEIPRILRIAGWYY